ncbi:MAG: hypothetical protein A2V70_07570 [Planctomycetes bacterium RBG_13_63_9]|nr:MAG: hypothetical protein A2V70_07570 [Planctomycetes bacterium RBG_13_63_9]
MTNHPVAVAAVLAAVVLYSAGLAAAEITAERSAQGVLVQVDGKPFTQYIVDFRGTPILWPIIGPTGKPLTRAYPMGEGTGERKDHPHHRSMWFTHGDVNGLSFWNRETIKHREFAKIRSGERAVIVSRNDWLAPDGKRVCEDERTLTFAADAETRRIDFDITVKAADGEVKFGDTKEGTFGVRVAGTMKVDAKLGGQIVNSEGRTNADAWGKPAAWVDYHGPVDGETVGIAILNHPGSFRFPTFWHVRTYGLFAANPFGLHDFQGSNDIDGSHTLRPGETMTFRYRVLLHRGDEKAGKVAEAYAAYAKEGK